MKTVIEMAREAGFAVVGNDDVIIADGWEGICTDEIERFAALVREDEREKQQEPLPDYINPPRYPKQQKLDVELSSDSEPVACWCRTCRPITMDDMRFVVCPDCGNKRCPKANDHRHACTNSNEPGQKGSAYAYTTPPTAAIAARQMRDAAVKECKDVLEGETNDSDYTLGFETAAANLAVWIAALPVPEVQWRDIVDGDVLEIMRKVSPATHPQLFARAVIAKFKEKQHG